MTGPRSAEAIDELLDRAWEAIDRGDLDAAQRWAGDVLAADATNAEAGELLAGGPGAGAGGQMRRLTIMFCDLVGSTALSARHEPERYRRIVGRYKLACRTIVEDVYDGHIAHVKGDGLLVLFGHPAAHEDDADRAVRAGLDVTAAVRQLSAIAEDEIGEALAARVAVHRGLVYLDTDEDEVYGLAPNLAARLQDLAPPGGLVISEEVLRLVAGRFATEPQEPRKVKGIDTPLASWRVLGERPHAGAGAGAAPLVGRDAELERLRAAWRARPASVVVQGEAGIGKTRLTTTLAAELAEGGARIVELAGSARHQAVGFHPVRALLEAGCRGAEPLDRLRRHLVAMGLDAEELVPLLAPVASIGPEAGYVAPPTDAAKLNVAIAGALGRYLRAVLGSGPAVLLVDDAHWLDGATSDLVATLVAHRPDGLLVVVAGRPDPALAPLTRSAVEVVELAPLPTSAGLALAAALDPGGATAEGHHDLVARSDGVPLFLEELVRAALDPEPEPPDDPLPAGRDPSIPDALYEPLVARLHAVPGAAVVAGAAATIGPVVDPALLRQLVATLGVDEPVLAAGFDALLAARVLEPDEGSGDSFRFRHELLRAVAYELQPPSVRRALHGRIADALGGMASTDWLVLAAHDEQAGRHVAAIGCYERAAGEARQRGALAEARVHLGRALGLVWALPEGPERDEREVQLRLQRGFLAVSAEGNASPDAAADYERCLDLASANPAGPGMFRTLVPLWGYYASRAQLERAYQVVDMGRAVLAGRREWVRPANDAARGMLDWFAGRFASAHEHLEGAAATLRTHADDRLRSDWALPNDPLAAISTHLGLARFVRGDPVGARAAFDHAARLAAELPFPQGPFSAAYNLTYASWVLLELGDDEAVEAAIGQLQAIVDAHGWDLWTAFATTRRLELDARRAAASDPVEGSVLDGLATAMDGTAMVFQAVDIRAFLTHLVTCHGAALAAAGHVEEARCRLAESLALADETGMHVYDAETHRVLAHVAHPAGDPGERDRALDAALGLATEQGAVAFGLRSARDLHLHRGGTDAAARDRLAAALRAFAPDASYPELDAARALLA